METVAQAYACEQGLEIDVDRANAVAALPSKDACIVAASLLKSARQMRSKSEAEACARRAAKPQEAQSAAPPGRRRDGSRGVVGDVGPLRRSYRTLHDSIGAAGSLC